METRDTQSVQSATLTLPPRTIGVAGAAPPDALAFISLIQQNAAQTPKSPGAEAATLPNKAIEDRASSQDHDKKTEDDQETAEIDAPQEEAPAVTATDDAQDQLPQPTTKVTSDDAPVDDGADEEDVVVADAKVAAPIQDAPQKTTDQEPVAETDIAPAAANGPLDQLGDGDAGDQASAVEAESEQGEAVSEFAAEQTDAVAEENSAAADSKTLKETKATNGKAKGTDADGKQVAAQEDSSVVVNEAAPQQDADKDSADTDETEQVLAAQEAAAAALEQEPVDNSPSDAEQFAADRREASEKIHQANEARHDVDADAGVDPTADVDAPTPPQPFAETISTPGTNAAVAAIEPELAPANSSTPQAAAATVGEVSGASEPGLGSAIQRGLQRGLLQKAKANSDAPKIDTAKQIQLIQRVSQAVRTSQTQGGPIRLRLSPPELGSLRVELEVEEGGVKAKLEAENETVKKVLLDNLPQLRDRLAELNLRVDSFDVSVGQNGNPQDAGGAFADQQSNSSNQQQAFGGRQSSSNVETPSVETTSAPIVTSDGQLNVMV